MNVDNAHIWIVVPAWNEAENLEVTIPQMVESLATVTEQGTVLVVDDGSSDATREVMTALMQRLPNVRVNHLNRNCGKAAALRTGFSEALDNGADILVMMDADGQDDPTELPGILQQLAARGGVVTGARTHDRKDRFVKKYTSRLYNAATRRMSGTPGTDFNSGFKAMTAQAAAAILPMLYGEMHRYITVIAHWSGFPVSEVNVVHHPRLHGTTKYGLARFWRGFVDLVTVRFLMSYESRPSHLFSGIGLVCGAIGTLALLYLLILRIMGNTIGDRPLLLAGILFVVVGVQFVLFGLLSELIVYGRKTTSTSDATRRSN